MIPPLQYNIEKKEDSDAEDEDDDDDDFGGSKKKEEDDDPVARKSLSDRSILTELLRESNVPKDFVYTRLCTK